MKLKIRKYWNEEKQNYIRCKIGNSSHISKEMSTLVLTIRCEPCSYQKAALCYSELIRLFYGHQIHIQSNEKIKANSLFLFQRNFHYLHHTN